jgi:hypothetical protein
MRSLYYYIAFSDRMSYIIAPSSPAAWGFCTSQKSRIARYIPLDYFLSALPQILDGNLQT